MSSAAPTFLARNRWPIALLALWSVSVGLIVILTPAGQPLPVTCLLRRATGLPCPTCGSTRAILALTRLDPAEALRLNPLVAALALLTPMLIALWVVFTRAKRPQLSATAITLAIVAALGANWAYLLLTRAAG
ncbi:MAG: DUF2752 domain-containing protein [Planctomycetota bacterium]|nr:DUF2752 domain-containing protein [Planctomycetota bacterium]